MTFKCPQCGRVLEAPEGVFAQEGTCRFCGATIVSPAAAGASATLKQAAQPGSFGPPGASSAWPAIVPARPNGLARASVVLGVLGIISCGITGAAGFVCGVIAMGQTRGTKEHGTAVAGMAISALTTLMVGPAILSAILFPVFSKARDRARDTTCLSNAKQLGVALEIYAQDNSDRLPPAATWDSAIMPNVYQHQGFACPSVPNGAARYKMNAAVGSSDVTLIASPGDTVALFDAAPGGTPFGGPNDVAARHGSPGYRTATIAFADGHAKLLSPLDLTDGAWKPRFIQRKSLPG